LLNKKKIKSLLATQSEPYHRARLLASSAAHSGDWLSAKPISACGLRLTDDAVRVAVGMRLGTELGQVHKCTCGASVLVEPMLFLAGTILEEHSVTTI